MTNNHTTEGQQHEASRHLGRFTAPTDLIARSWEDAKAAMDGIVVIRAWTVEGTIFYVALSEQFAVLNEGDEVPEYRCVLTRTHDGPVARWELIDVPKQPREITWEE
jgi:hypothetical protein